MTKLPSLTPIQVIRKLKKAAFIFDRQAKGSHVVEGITMNTVEIFLGILEDPISRKADPESGQPVLVTG